MSDTSPGEGWWQASDGRWYAPETHPDLPWNKSVTSGPPGLSDPIGNEEAAGGTGARDMLFASSDAARRNRRKVPTRPLPIVVGVAVLSLAAVGVVLAASGSGTPAHDISAPVGTSGPAVTRPLPASTVTQPTPTVEPTTAPPTTVPTTAPPTTDVQAAQQATIAQDQSAVDDDQAAVQQDAATLQTLASQRTAEEGAIAVQRQQEAAQVASLQNSGQATAANLAALAATQGPADQASEAKLASIVSAQTAAEAQYQQDVGQLESDTVALQVAQDVAATPQG
jgi:hypothetical protein